MDCRADHLRAAPAKVRFLSVEPLLEILGPVNLSGINWVIVGGESGPGARPMEAAWVRRIRAAKVSFCFKQWGGEKSFAFTIFDPKGWKGIELEVISPLLKITPGEILINFMTSFTRRFIESQDSELVPGFDRLYGGPVFRGRRASVPWEDRDDTMVEECIRQIKSAGAFRFVCYTPVFQAQFNDVQFHLIPPST